MKKTDASPLTKSQKALQIRMLKTAKKMNEKGEGFTLGDGYNSSWHKVLNTLIEKKALVTKKGKKGFWLR